MYGKFFASAFTGSMMGAGSDVFAVWSYAIAHCVDGQVELNPKLLASVIGTSEKRAEAAIGFLCAPDPNSRSKTDDGRRLVREGQFAYRVPNHGHYLKIQNEGERREYNRIKKAESRSRGVKARVNDSQAMSAVSAQEEEEAYTDKEEKKKTTLGYADGFEAVWKVYPRRAGGNSKADAGKAFSARVREGVSHDDLLAGVERYAAYIRATGKEGSEYVKLGATFFGPSQHYAESWNAPPATRSPGTQLTQQDRNKLVLDNWLAKEEAQNG